MEAHVSEKASFTTPPSAKTISTISAAMAATSRPYSTAEAPLSAVSMTLRIRASMLWVLSAGAGSDRDTPRGCRTQKVPGPLRAAHHIGGKDRPLMVRSDDAQPPPGPSVRTSPARTAIMTA